MLSVTIIVAIALLTLLGAIFAFQVRNTLVAGLSLVAFILSVVLLILGVGTPAA